MRIILAYDQHNKLKDLGFYLYLDEKGKLKRDKIICSPESSWRLDIKPFDIVVLDESESIFAQLSSKTMMSGDVHHSLAIIYNNIRRAKQVIALDAFLGERTVNLLLRYRHTDSLTNKIDKSDFFIQHNKFKLNSQDIFYCYSDSVLWDQKLHTALNTGKKIVVCSFKSASKTKIEADRINAIFPNLNIACYTRETKPSKKREHFSNFNDAVKDVDVLIYTSTLDVGVSVEIQRFDQCFIFIEPACPTTVEHVLQMCRRVRNLADHEYHVYMKPKWNNIPEKIKDIETMIQTDYHLAVIASDVKYNIFGLAHEIDEHGHFIYHKSDYYYTHIENLRNKFLSKNHFKDLFIHFIQQLGAKYIPEESATEILRDYKKKAEKDKTFTVDESELTSLLEEFDDEYKFRGEIKDARRNAYTAYYDSIAHSENIDDKKAKEIENKIRNSEDIEDTELLSLKKYTLAKIYNEAVEDIQHGKEVKLLSDPKYMKHYKNILEIKDFDIITKLKEMAVRKLNRFEIYKKVNDNEGEDSNYIDMTDIIDDLRKARLIKLNSTENKKSSKSKKEHEIYSDEIQELKDKYKHDYKAFIDLNCKDNFIKHFICWLLIQICGYDSIFDTQTISREQLEDNINENCPQLEEWLYFISYVFERTRFRNKIIEWKFEDKLKYINGILSSMYGCSIKCSRVDQTKGKKLYTDYKINHTIEFSKKVNIKSKK